MADRAWLRVGLWVKYIHKRMIETGACGSAATSSGAFLGKQENSGNNKGKQK